MLPKLTRTDAEWREHLTPEQYGILREGGTERAFTGKYEKNKATGTYSCVGCDQALFEGAAKFDSGSGWPSFTAPTDEAAVHLQPDHTHGGDCTEVICAHCEGHLGHVFADGPAPDGLRYCINSAALRFQPEENGGE